MNKKIKTLIGTLLLCSPALTMVSCQSKSESVELRILHSSDIHGHVFPYNFLKAKADGGSMARLASIVKESRSKGENLLLLDGGDILQGDPSAYYYSYIDSSSVHLITAAMNYLKYDAATPGNHDIETGHAVYDKWTRECEFPILAANVIDKKTGNTYWKPYELIEREGLKIAVVGFVTPAIPQWLPEILWDGLEFEDISSKAKKIVPEIIKKEQPDLLIALLHSGIENKNPYYTEDAGRELAQSVSGIDIIFLGHDHRESIDYEQNPDGAQVVLANPGSSLMYLSDLRVKFERRGNKTIGKSIEAKLCQTNNYKPDADFLKHFAYAKDAVKTFVDEKIGSINHNLIGSESLFGPSALLDLVHKLQLDLSGADISFAAPLSTKANINAGNIRVRDLFAIYPYENFLCTLDLSGKEVLDYLEYSYSLWCNTMNSADDALILMRPDTKATDRFPTLNPTFNYSSAAGIDYEVDVQKPVGERVRILQMSNGKAFEEGKMYRVAMNSYRANGGGGHLTEGSKIAPSELKKRIVTSTDKDLRLAMINYFRQNDDVKLRRDVNWQFTPAEWAEKAILREMKLFSEPSR